MRRRPPVGLAATPLPEVVTLFLKEKERIGRADRTTASLKNTLDAFLAQTPSKIVADFTREAVTSYLDHLDFPAPTIRNHRARLATFGNWLARRQYRLAQLQDEPPFSREIIERMKGACWSPQEIGGY